MFKSSNTLPFSKKEDSFSFDSIDAPKWVDFSKLDSDPQEEDDSWFDEKSTQSIPKDLLKSFGCENVEIPRSSPMGKKEISFAKVIGETQRAVKVVGETQRGIQIPTEEETSTPPTDPEPLEPQQQEPEPFQQEGDYEDEEEQEEQVGAGEGGFAIKRKRKMNNYAPQGEMVEEDTEGFAGDYYYSSDSYYEPSDYDSRPKKLRRTAPQPPGPLTNPQTPHLQTKIRGQMYEEKFNRMVAQEEETFKKNQLFKAGEIKHYKGGIAKGVAYHGERGEGLTAPVTPKLETRVRGEMKEYQLAEKIRRQEEEEELYSSYNFKAGEINYHTSSHSHAPSAPRPLTAPVTPCLQTRTRGEMKEQQLAEKIRREEEAQQFEPFKAGEINYHTSSHSHAPSAPRPLTAPVTPRLQTRARGEVKEYQLAEKIRKEEELRQVEPFKAGEINYHTSTRSYAPSAPRPLTAPVTPNLRTRVRGEVKEYQLAEKIRKEEEDNIPKQFKAGEIKHYKSRVRDAPAPRPLTAPVTPNLRTRVRGEVRKTEAPSPVTHNNHNNHKQYQPRGLTQPMSPRLRTRMRGEKKQTAEPSREHSAKRGRTMMRKERDLTEPQPFSFQTDRRAATRTNNTNENDNYYSGEKKYSSTSAAPFSSPLSANRIREDNVSVKL